MIWTIALNVWLLLVGFTWMDALQASQKFLGEAAIVVVIIFIIEMFYTHRAALRDRF